MIGKGKVGYLLSRITTNKQRIWNLPVKLPEIEADRGGMTDVVGTADGDEEKHAHL